MDFCYLLTRALAALALGSTIVFLRRSIGQQKGLLVELAAIAIPFCATAICLFVYGLTTWTAQLPFGTILGHVTKVIFIAIPLLAVVWTLERIHRGEPQPSSELFWLTAAAAMGTFGAVTFQEYPSTLQILTATAIVLGGEAALESKYHGRRWSIAFTLGFLLASCASAVTHASILDLFEFGGTAPSLHTTTGRWSLVAFVACLTSAPMIVQRGLLLSGPMQELAWRLSCWRFSLTDPARDFFHREIIGLWHFRTGICYLNHGSFGAVPLRLQRTQDAIRQRCAQEPMDFLAREADAQWRSARFQLANWLGTAEANLAFCENATAGMNELAHWFPLDAGDEVLINDHEYGAVRRIWQRKCDQSHAKLIESNLGLPLESPQAIVEQLLADSSSKTRLVVVSHITSPTAIRFPIDEICDAFHQRGIAVCVDGPHAILQESFRLNQLRCDFYTASLHKWLCCPLGTGFVYVAPQWHDQVQPARLSWGRLEPNQPQNWSDELIWTGTRDFSGYLSVPKSIEFFSRFDRSRLDRRNHALANHARSRLLEISGTQPVTPAGREWFGWMVAVQLPDGDHSTLQNRLFERHGIEVPIVAFQGKTLVRVSCPYYVNAKDIEYLCRCLQRELR